MKEIMKQIIGFCKSRFHRAETYVETKKMHEILSFSYKNQKNGRFYKMKWCGDCNKIFLELGKFDSEIAKYFPNPPPRNKFLKPVTR